MTGKRIPPGTRIREVAAALIDASLSLGRGVTVAEVREAYAKRFGALDARAFPRALARLESDGEAEKIGGRHRRTQWRHAGHPVPHVDTEDCSPAVVAAVQALYREHERAVSAREVAGEVRRRGRSGLTEEQVRHLLYALAHTSVRKAARTHAGWAEPRVQRVDVTTAGGRRRVHWAPVGVCARLPDFSDARDVVRYAVGCAAAAVGRPVTRREVRLWARVQLADSEARTADRTAAEFVDSGRFRTALASASRDDAAGAGEGRLRIVRTPLSSRGVYAPRFSTGALTPVQEAACLVEDLSILLRPQTELESIQDLRAEAQEIGSSVLLRIATVRERALTEAVARAIPSAIQSGDELARACALADSAREVVASWAQEVAPNRRGNPNGDGELPGFLRVAELWQGDRMPYEGTVTVDLTSGVAMREFDALAGEALSIGERGARFWSPMVVGARRIRGPLTGGNSWEEPEDAQSFLDRPDTLSAILRSCHLPMISALADTAVAVLGHVVRDSRPLLIGLESLGAGESMTRQALVVALGLLGSPPPLEIAWVNPCDPDEAAAYYASLALGVDDQGERVRLAREVDRMAFGAAMEVSDRGVLELEGGARLAVVG